MNDEETVARLLPEPPDGTRLVVQRGEHEYTVIWRDDTEAKKWRGDFETEHWFDDPEMDPMEFYQKVKYAEAVWRVDGEPIARFEEEVI